MKKLLLSICLIVFGLQGEQQVADEVDLKAENIQLITCGTWKKGWQSETWHWALYHNTKTDTYFLTSKTADGTLYIEDQKSRIDKVEVVFTDDQQVTEIKRGDEIMRIQNGEKKKLVKINGPEEKIIGSVEQSDMCMDIEFFMQAVKAWNSPHAYAFPLKQNHIRVMTGTK